MRLVCDTLPTKEHKACRKLHQKQQEHLLVVEGRRPLLQLRSTKIGPYDDKVASNVMHKIRNLGQIALLVLPVVTYDLGVYAVFSQRDRNLPYRPGFLFVQWCGQKVVTLPSSECSCRFDCIRCAAQIGLS